MGEDEALAMVGSGAEAAIFSCTGDLSTTAEAEQEEAVEISRRMGVESTAAVEAPSAVQPLRTEEVTVDVPVPLTLLRLLLSVRMPLAAANEAGRVTVC